MRPKVAERLRDALNSHDLTACFQLYAEEYRSDQPAHPDRRFIGRERVLKNWAAIFRAVPDFEVELLESALHRGVLWTEWTWSGTRLDGTELDMRGTILFGLRVDGAIAWGRPYLEPVSVGRGIDGFIESFSHA